MARIDSLVSAGEKIPALGRNTVHVDELEKWETECEIFLSNLLGEEHLITQKFKIHVGGNSPYQSAVEIGKQILNSIKSDLELGIIQNRGKLGSIGRISEELIENLPTEIKKTAQTVNQLINNGIPEAIPPMLRKLIHNLLLFGLKQLNLPSTELEKCEKDLKRLINLCIQLNLITNRIGSGLRNVKILGDELAHSPHGTAYIQSLTEDIRVINIAIGEIIPRLRELLQNPQKLESKIRKIPQLKAGAEITNVKTKKKVGQPEPTNLRVDILCEGEPPFNQEIPRMVADAIRVLVINMSSIILRNCETTAEVKSATGEKLTDPVKLIWSSHPYGESEPINLNRGEKQFLNVIKPDYYFESFQIYHEHSNTDPNHFFERTYRLIITLYSEDLPEPVEVEFDIIQESRNITLKRHITPNNEIENNNDNFPLKSTLLQYINSIKETEIPYLDDLNGISTIFENNREKIFNLFSKQELLELIQILTEKYFLDKYDSDEIPIIILKIFTFFKWDNQTIREEFRKFFLPTLKKYLVSLEGSDLRSSNQTYLRDRYVFTLQIIQELEPVLLVDVVKGVINWSGYSVKHFFNFDLSVLTLDQLKELQDYYKHEKPRWRKDRPRELLLTAIKEHIQIAINKKIC